MAGGEAAEPTERTALASASVALRMDDSGSLRLKRLQGADRRGVCAFVGLLCISVVAGVLAVGMRRTTAGAHLSSGRGAHKMPGALGRAGRRTCGAQAPHSGY